MNILHDICVIKSPTGDNKTVTMRKATFNDLNPLVDFVSLNNRQSRINITDNHNRVNIANYLMKYLECQLPTSYLIEVPDTNEIIGLSLSLSHDYLKIRSNVLSGIEPMGNNYQNGDSLILGDIIIKPEWQGAFELMIAKQQLMSSVFNKDNFLIISQTSGYVNYWNDCFDKCGLFTSSKDYLDLNQEMHGEDFPIMDMNLDMLFSVGKATLIFPKLESQDDAGPNEFTVMFKYS